MNHIYKSIFNKALGVFTAVPEFASAHGKGSERTVVGRVAKGTAGFAASALAISIGLALTSTSAVAGPGIYINDGTDTGCLALPDASGPNFGIYSISGTSGIGHSILAPGQTNLAASYFATDVMSPCQSSGNVVQALDTQTNRTLFYGNNSYGNGTITNNGAKNLTLGGRLDVNSGIIGVGDRGTNGTGATNSIRMGTGTTLDDANKQWNSISVGVDAGVNTASSVAIGYGAKAGKTDKFLGQGAVALGYNAQALGTSNISIGEASSATNGHNGVAIGAYSKTENEKTISIGAFSTASGAQSTVISSNYDTNSTGPVSVASGRRSQIYGAETTVSGEQSVSIGDTNTVASHRTYAIGNNINVAAGVDEALAFGTKAAVGGANAIALGNTASAAINNAIAVGQASSSTGNSAIAIGTKASAQGDSALAHGVEAQAIAQSSTAIGFRAKAQGYEQISIGSNAGNSSPANAENYGAVFIGRHAGSGNNSATGNTDGVSIGSNAGQNAVSGIKNVAIGPTTGQYVEGSQNLALSTNAGNSVKGDNNLAMMVGAGNNIEGGNNIAIGTNANSGTPTAKRVVTNSIAMGSNTQATSNNTIAIGPQARALAADAVALGLGSLSNHANSVALGAGSATSAAHTGDYTLNTSYTAAGLPVTANGTVSVGSAGKERQIQNVAAGVISATSTDAINGSQLYATNNYMNNFAGDVKTKLGGNAALGNDGHLTMTNIGGTGENTVDDAIKNLKTAIDNKADTTASVTSENQADIKVDKEAPVGNTTNYKLSLGNDAKAKLAKAATALQTVEGDSNITATKDATDPTKVKLALNKNLTADSLTLGDTTTAEHVVLNKDGLTVGNLGPALSNSGIDMRGGQIGNLVGGAVRSGDRTAVSAGMLYDVAQSVKDAIGGETLLDSDDPTKGLPAGRLTLSNVGETGENTIHDAIKSVNDKAKTAVQEIESANPTALSVKKDGTKVTLTPNFITGDLVNADGTVNAPAAADEGKLVSAKTVADALKANHFVVDTKGNTETGSEADAKVGSGNKVTFEAGNNLVAKQANTANGGATVKFSLKDDISLNSVTAGTGDNQVVLGNDGVKVGGNTYINNDGLNANSKVISNVADGVNPNDAVNKSQLDAVKGVADSAVKSVDTVASEENLVVDNNDPQNPKLRLKKAVNLTSIKLDGATPGNTTYVSGYGLTIEDGPSVKKAGINAGDKKITNVAAGDVSATSKDAVNGGQLHNVATSVANVLGGNAAVDGNGNVTSSDIGGTGANTVDDAIKAVNATAAKHTTVVEGKNVKVTKGKNAAGGDEYTVATKDDLDVTSVTAGNTTVNTNGLTITGGPSVTRGGIDAGNRVISGVKAGDVSATSQEAVNGSQLYATNTKLDGVKAKADTAVQDVKSGDENALTAVKDPNTNIVTVTPKLSGDLVDANGNITAPTAAADKGKLVTAGTVAQALANTHFVVDTKATDGELDTASQADQKIKAGNKVTLQAGKNLKAKQTNGANGAQVEFSLKDSISLTEVTAGTGDNQVVLGNNGVQVGGNTYINKDGLNANSKVISNVADGVNPNDAVNKGQLDAVKGVADSAVKSVDVANGEQNLVVDNSDPKNPKLSLKKDLTVDSVKAGDSTLNTDGLTITGGPSVKKDGINAGDKTITNVADGVNAKDAVNKGQLDAVDTKVSNVAQNVVNVLGGDAKAEGNGDITMSNIGGTGKNTVHDAIAAVNKSATAAKTKVVNGKNITVDPVVNPDGSTTYTISTAENLDVTSVTAGDSTLNNDGLTITGGPSVKKDGIDAADKKITNVAPGAVTSTSKDAVNGSQLYSVAGNVKDLIGPDVTIDSATGNITVADPAKGIGGTGKGTIGDAIAAVNKSAVAANTKVKAGSNITVNEVIDEKDGSKTYTVSTAKDLNVDSVKAGNTTINNNGIEIVNGPSMTKDGINAAGKAISNVANGNVAKGSKDAVNGGQLHETAQSVADVIGGGATVKDGKVVAGQNGIGNTGQNTVHGAIAAINQNTANNFNQIRGDLRKMDRDLRGGIAGALATAGLPQAFRPGKSMVAAAASTYRGQSGLAIGVSRISDNGKVILKVTGNTNSRGDFGGTIGAGYQW